MAFGTTHHEKGRTKWERREQCMDVVLASQGSSGGRAGGPGPLKVETAEMAGHVDDFADEIKAGNLAAFHGFRGEFSGVDAACGHFGFLVAFGSRWRNWPGM